MTEPRARRTDPETSHAAARSVLAHPGREAVLACLLVHGPQTDEELYEHTEVRLYCSPSGARTRRSELVDAGVVRDSRHRRKTKSGRQSIVWEAVEHQTRAAGVHNHGYDPSCREAMVGGTLRGECLT